MKNEKKESMGMNKEFVSFVVGVKNVVDMSKVEKEYGEKLNLKYKNFERVKGRRFRDELKEVLVGELKGLGVSMEEFKKVCSRISEDISVKFGSNRSYVWVKV